MAKSILILDDDIDFNSLLTDIYSQANYEVFSEQDPERALEVFRDQGFDLVVTDQKMPNLSGAEFMRKIKAIRADVPVIMVSGYLDNDTIRDLIKEGVGGVFLKPLNVFSLLKRTAELIEESQSERSSSSEEWESQAAARSEYTSSLPFRFRSYPCKSDVSASFAKKLHALRDFKTNMLLIGEPGIAFKAICEDMRGFSEDPDDRFVFLTNEQLTPQRFNPILEQAYAKTPTRITLVLLEAESMGDEAKRLILKVAKKEGEYGQLDIPARLIFCINEDLDTLYEKGLIDESLYILMGTSEARAPALRECRDDIPILAQQYVVDAVVEKGQAGVPRIDKTGRNWLKEQDWPENHAGLREVVTHAVSRVKEDVLSADHFAAALSDGDYTRMDLSNELFVDILKRTRDDYMAAMLVMCGDDPERASRNLGIDASLLNPDTRSVR